MQIAQLMTSLCIIKYQINVADLVACDVTLHASIITWLNIFCADYVYHDHVGNDF